MWKFDRKNWGGNWIFGNIWKYGEKKLGNLEIIGKFGEEKLKIQGKNWKFEK